MQIFLKHRAAAENFQKNDARGTSSGTKTLQNNPNHNAEKKYACSIMVGDNHILKQNFKIDTQSPAAKTGLRKVLVFQTQRFPYPLCSSPAVPMPSVPDSVNFCFRNFELCWILAGYQISSEMISLMINYGKRSEQSFHIFFSIALALFLSNFKNLSKTEF